MRRGASRAGQPIQHHVGEQVIAVDGFAARAVSAGVRVAPGPLVEPDGHGLAELARLVDTGELGLHLDRVFPSDQAAQAHAHAENGATGKTVLRIAD
jgi:NADPH:quinone reductase-like Zn-dependent oxidoreductase